MVRISGLTGERERGALPTCKVALLRACRETRREGELAGARREIPHQSQFGSVGLDLEWTQILGLNP